MTRHVLIAVADKENKKVLLQEKDSKLHLLKTAVDSSENSLEASVRLLKDFAQEKINGLEHIGNFVDENRESCFIYKTSLDFNSLKERDDIKTLDVKDIQRIAMADKLNTGVWEALQYQGILKKIKKPSKTSLKSYGIH